MAKKARTPPPPRRPVQAPKQRSDPRPTREDRRPLLYLVIFAASGLVILGGIVLWLAMAGSGSSADSSAVAASMRARGCTYKTYKDQGRKHFSSPTQTFKYNSFPPTSGTHEPTPAVWNIYEEPIDQRILVHNLEHGGIVIQYGKNVPESTVNQLRGFYQSSPNGLVLAPLPRLGDKVAVTAWTRLSTCTKFNKKAFTTFRDAYRAKGPEPFTLDQLAPGT